MKVIDKRAASGSRVERQSVALLDEARPEDTSREPTIVFTLWVVIATALVTVFLIAFAAYNHAESERRADKAAERFFNCWDPSPSDCP